jgi:hypothetical protein
MVALVLALQPENPMVDISTAAARKMRFFGARSKPDGAIAEAAPVITSPSAIVRLPLPPQLTEKRSGMKVAFSSTVYRGLPFFGGQPLPVAHTPQQHRGSWSSLSLSPCSGSRAVGRRNALKFRRYMSGTVWWPATLTTDHIRNEGEVVVDRDGWRQEQLSNQPAAVIHARSACAGRDPS